METSGGQSRSYSDFEFQLITLSQKKNKIIKGEEMRVQRTHEYIFAYQDIHWILSLA